MEMVPSLSMKHCVWYGNFIVVHQLCWRARGKVSRTGLPHWPEDPWSVGHLQANSFGCNYMFLGWVKEA